MRQINTLKQLKELACELGVRNDWHEPDEQGVTAEVLGRSFDNAGFWGDMSDPRFGGSYEMWVRLSKDGKPVADVNLATLFAWACGLKE